LEKKVIHNGNAAAIAVQTCINLSRLEPTQGPSLGDRLMLFVMSRMFLKYDIISNLRDNYGR